MDISILLAIVSSPVVAVLVTIWMQNRKEKRAAKLWIFNTLIGNRHAALSDQNIRALNLIDVIFYDTRTVRRLWREYFDMLNNDGLNNPNGWGARQKKNLEMITAIAGELGYKDAITHLDVDRVYYPIALEAQARRNQELSDEVLNFLKAVGQTLAANRQPPPQQPPPAG